MTTNLTWEPQTAIFGIWLRPEFWAVRNFQANGDGSLVDMHRYTITRDQ